MPKISSLFIESLSGMKRFSLIHLIIILKIRFIEKYIIIKRLANKREYLWNLQI